MIFELSTGIANLIFGIGAYHVLEKSSSYIVSVNRSSIYDGLYGRKHIERTQIMWLGAVVFKEALAACERETSYPAFMMADLKTGINKDHTRVSLASMGMCSTL